MGSRRGRLEKLEPWQQDINNATHCKTSEHYATGFLLRINALINETINPTGNISA